MKLIIAFIRPELLNSVKSELFAREIYAVSVTNILGAGQQKGYTEQYRGVTRQVNLLKKIRLELCVPAAKEEAAIEAILTGGKTGAHGDGVILVQNVEKAIRVRTGQPLESDTDA